MITDDERTSCMFSLNLLISSDYPAQLHYEYLSSNELLFAMEFQDRIGYVLWLSPPLPSGWIDWKFASSPLSCCHSSSARPSAGLSRSLARLLDIISALK